MNNKKLFLILLIFGLIAMTVNTYAEVTKLKSIGHYAFAPVKGKISDQEAMKSIVDRYTADIKLGFEMAGYGDLYLPFLDQMKTATFSDSTWAVGDRVMWMLFRNQGKVKVTKEVEWAGKAPLDVFAVDVTKDYKIYHFIIPKPCGNIGLKNIVDAPPPPAVYSLAVTPEKANLNEPITIDMSGSKNAKGMVVDVLNAKGEKVASQTLTPESPKAQIKLDQPGEYVIKAKDLDQQDIALANTAKARTYINVPPVCKLRTSCLSCKDYVGRMIAFDASGSTDPDGEIVKAVFEITDAEGHVVDTFTKTEKPLLWEKTFLKAGVYTITATVFDNAGAVSPASDACRVSFEVTQKKLLWLLEAGPLMARGTYHFYGFIRGGMFYWLSPDRFSFVASAGGAVPVQGEPWKSIFLANALVNVHTGPMFIGGGLGYSSKEQNTRKSGLDVVGNIGIDVLNNWTSTGSIFFEFRSPLGSSRSFAKQHKFALGFRMVF